MSEGDEGRKFQFLRNGDAEPSELDWNKGVESARQAISEAMNAKNVAFLLGAGCSSLVKGGKELGISTMAPLAKEFCGETLDARKAGFYTTTSPTEGSEHGAITDDNASAAEDIASETIAEPRRSFSDSADDAVHFRIGSEAVAVIASAARVGVWNLGQSADYIQGAGGIAAAAQRRYRRSRSVVPRRRSSRRHSPRIPSGRRRCCDWRRADGSKRSVGR